MRVAFLWQMQIQTTKYAYGCDMDKKKIIYIDTLIIYTLSCEL